MKPELPETVEIESEALAQFVVFMGREIAEWDALIPDDVASEDYVWDEVHASNVTEVEGLGDGSVAVRGKFTVPIVVDYIRGTWHHPPETKTERHDAMFEIVFWFEDEGYAEGYIEVM